MYKQRPASSLPVYDRAISYFPHLASVRDAKAFCRQLLLLGRSGIVFGSPVCGG